MKTFAQNVSCNIRVRSLFVVLIAAFSYVSLSYAQTKVEACSRLINNSPLVKALTAEYGDPHICKQSKYKETEWGTYETLVVSWPQLSLTVSYKPPETGIYVIELEEGMSLSSEWFETNRDEIISQGFAINWTYDAFPGPSAEHYEGKETGNNAQVWIERNANHGITWFRFSYAL